MYDNYYDKEQRSKEFFELHARDELRRARFHVKTEKYKKHAQLIDRIDLHHLIILYSRYTATLSLLVRSHSISCILLI